MSGARHHLWRLSWQPPRKSSLVTKFIPSRRPPGSRPRFRRSPELRLHALQQFTLCSLGTSRPRPVQAQPLRSDGFRLRGVEPHRRTSARLVLLWFISVTPTRTESLRTVAELPFEAEFRNGNNTLSLPGVPRRAVAQIVALGFAGGVRPSLVQRGVLQKVFPVPLLVRSARSWSDCRVVCVDHLHRCTSDQRLVARADVGEFHCRPPVVFGGDRLDSLTAPPCARWLVAP